MPVMIVFRYTYKQLCQYYDFIKQGGLEPAGCLVLIADPVLNGVFSPQWFPEYLK